MQTIIREMRGIPFFLLKEYLVDMGGKEVDENHVEGPGWHVTLTRMEPFRIGSLSVGQAKLEIEIEDKLVDGFMETFNLKTWRAGG